MLLIFSLKLSLLELKDEFLLLLRERISLNIIYETKTYSVGVNCFVICYI